MRNCPWTDGEYNQEMYEKNVQLWCLYNNELPVNNPNRIIPEVRGVTLQGQLYERAIHLYNGISDHIIASKDGAEGNCNNLHKRNDLLTVSTSVDGFNTLLNTTRHTNETFRSF